MQPTGSMRKLHYPLNRVEDIESETPLLPEEFLSIEEWTTTDSDERIDVVMNLSLNEYVAIANVVDVGRDIAYGDNSIYIWWLWLRMLSSVSICDSIIACIADDGSGVADAINAVVSLETMESSVAVAQSLNNTSLGDGSNPLCDDDILFGQCKQMVDYLDQLNEDALEILEVETNTAEFISEVIGDITIIDETSIDAVLAWVTKLQDDIAENYSAQITVAYKDAIACEFFCEARLNNCGLTPDIMFTVFKNRLSATVTIESLISNTLDYLVGGAWSGTEIADFLFFSQLGFRSQLGRFIGNIAFADIDLRMRIYANDPDSDWTSLCDACADWTEIFDFTLESFDSLISQWDVSYPAVWQSGLGWVMAHDALGARGGIILTFPSIADVVEAEVTAVLNVTATNTRSTGVGVYDAIPTPFNQVDSNYSIIQADGVHSREVDGLFEDIGWVVGLGGSRQGASGTARINRIEISGQGVNPFL